MKCGYEKCSKTRGDEESGDVTEQGIMRGGVWYCSLSHYEEQIRVDWDRKSKIDLRNKCRNVTCQNQKPTGIWKKMKKGEGLTRDGFWYCSTDCYDADIKRKWDEERERYLSQSTRIHKVRFGALLIQEGAITPEQLESALVRSKKTKKRIGESLLEQGDISEDALTKILSRQEGIPKIDLSRTTLNPDVINLINKAQAKKYKALPIEILKRTSTLVIAISDPSDKLSLIDLKYITGYTVEPFIVPESALRSALKRYYDLTDEDFETQFIKQIEQEPVTTGAESTITRKEAIELKNAVNVILSSIKKKGAKNFKMRADEKMIIGSFDYGNIQCTIDFKKKS